MMSLLFKNRRILTLVASFSFLCFSHPAPAKINISLRPDTVKYKVWDNVGELGKSEKVKFIYNVDFVSYFDNREYKSVFQIPQTIFNFRFSPAVGMRLWDKFGGRHELVAGLHYTQPLGGNWNEAFCAPTAYYQFDIRGFRVQLGAVPYTERRYTLPDWLMYDSITYAHPNIQGALMSYGDRRGYVEFMCDWRGRQTPERQEMFRLMINGLYQYKWFRAGGIAQLNHKASPAKPNHEGVCDDIYISPKTGFDLSRYARMDSLSLSIGYILGVQRLRQINDCRTPQGLLIEFYANWWFLGLRNVFYLGDNLMPHYNVSDYTFDGKPYGARLNQGDPFYQAHIYNRTDIFLYLYRNNFVNCFFSWNFHYDGYKLSHQQQLQVRFSLNGMKHQHKLHSLLDK